MTEFLFEDKANAGDLLSIFLFFICPFASRSRSDYRTETVFCIHTEYTRHSIHYKRTYSTKTKNGNHMRGRSTILHYFYKYLRRQSDGLGYMHVFVFGSRSECSIFADDFLVMEHIERMVKLHEKYMHS